jgi:hypothetical protein
MSMEKYLLEAYYHYRACPPPKSKEQVVQLVDTIWTSGKVEKSSLASAFLTFIAEHHKTS